MNHDELEQLISFLYTGFVTFNSQNESQKFKDLLHHFKIHVPSSTEDEISPLLLLNDQSEFLSSSGSSVDQNAILYEFQTAFNPNQQEDVNSILAEIISEYNPKDENSRCWYVCKIHELLSFCLSFQNKQLK